MWKREAAGQIQRNNLRDFGHHSVETGESDGGGGAGVGLGGGGLPIVNLSLTSPEFLRARPRQWPPPPNAAVVYCRLGDRAPFETRSVKWPSGLRRLSWSTRQTNRQTHRQTDLWSCVCFSAYTVVHVDLSVCLSAMHVFNLTALWIETNPTWLLHLYILYRHRYVNLSDCTALTLLSCKDGCALCPTSSI